MNNEPLLRTVQNTASTSLSQVSLLVTHSPKSHTLPVGSLFSLTSTTVCDPASKMQAPTSVVIMTQPACNAIPQGSNWQTGVCDCCSDFGVCLCGLFCFPCLSCQVSSDMNECCLCGGSVAMRTLYRTRYGIPGSICNDFLTTLCCPVCSLCQLKRDINRRRAMNAF